MKRKNAILTLIIPTLGALALLVWSFGFPLAACFSENETSLNAFFENVAFIHVTVFLFDIPAYAWVPLALTGYTLGAWLVLKSKTRIKTIIGTLLSTLPIVLIALGPLSDYRGP